MQNLTFDQLPHAVSSLFKKLESIERLLIKDEPQLSDKDNLLRPKEAGKLLHLSVPTIYTKVSRRELPCLKQNGRLYFIESELLNYLKLGRKETIAEIQRATLEGLKKEGGAK